MPILFKVYNKLLLLLNERTIQMNKKREIKREQRIMELWLVLGYS